MSVTSVRSFGLDEIPWSEVGRVLGEDPRLIIAAGALEQHGPHLPLGTNTRIAEAVVLQVSERLGILRAPTLSYGVVVPGGPYPGRAGIRRKTLHRVVNELFAQWEDQGVEEFVVVTAHRFEPHLEPLLMALTDRAKKSVYDLYEIDVSDLLETDPEQEHGGELETSLMLHLAPELVRRDAAEDFVPEGSALRRYTRRRVPKGPPSSRGVIGSPSRAEAAKGGRILHRWVETLVATLGGRARRAG